MRRKREKVREREPSPDRLIALEKMLLPEEEHFISLEPEEQRFVLLAVRQRVPIRTALRETGVKLTDKLIAACEHEQRLLAKASGISRKRVMEGFLEAIELAKIQADPSAMIAGWREIGRMCGYYEPERKEFTFSVDASALYNKLRELPDEVLLRIVEESQTQEVIDVTPITPSTLSENPESPESP
jgi:hypothetical protein